VSLTHVVSSSLLQYATMARTHLAVFCLSFGTLYGTNQRGCSSSPPFRNCLPSPSPPPLNYASSFVPVTLPWSYAVGRDSFSVPLFPSPWFLCYHFFSLGSPRCISLAVLPQLFFPILRDDLVYLAFTLVSLSSHFQSPLFIYLHLDDLPFLRLSILFRPFVCFLPPFSAAAIIGLPPGQGRTPFLLSFSAFNPP